MPYELPVGQSTFLLQVNAGQPGEMSQDVALYLDENQVLKEVYLEFKGTVAGDSPVDDTKE